MTRRKITSTRSFILARERATPSSSIPSIRTPRSARPAEMMSTHPSIRAVSRPTRDVAFARAMDANARVKKTKKNDASDLRTSWIDRVDAGYSDATGRPRVDDARARDPSRGRHPRVRPRGRSAGGARAFSVVMREGGVCRVVIGRWKADAGGRAHAPISVARDCHHQCGDENVVTSAHTYSLQTR